LVSFPLTRTPMKVTPRRGCESADIAHQWITPVPCDGPPFEHPKAPT
jgi:hypothetical protein